MNSYLSDFINGMKRAVCVIVVQVRELIRKIQEAYVETLEELSWMDEQSKEKAREKVRCS